MLKRRAVDMAADPKLKFSASVWREGNWCVSQCLEVDVAIRGPGPA